MTYYFLKRRKNGSKGGIMQNRSIEYFERLLTLLENCFDYYCDIRWDLESQDYREKNTSSYPDRKAEEDITF
jgi:hypothetical protein